MDAIFRLANIDGYKPICSSFTRPSERTIISEVGSEDTSATGVYCDRSCVS